MTLVLILSIVVRLAAVGIALVLWLRWRDRWFAILGGGIAISALRPVLTLLTLSEDETGTGFTAAHLDELPGLAVSFVALAAVLFLRRVVADRRRADASLRESERRFRDLIDASVDRYWEMDEHFRFTYAVEQADQQRTPPPEAVLGRTRWEVAGVDPYATEKWRRHQADLDARRPFRDFRFSVPDDQGRIIHWRASGKPIFDADGTFRGYRGTATDETRHVERRRQTEQALRESEARAARARAQLVDAIESLTDGFALYDASDRLVVCNEKYREIYPRAAHLMIPGLTFEEQIRASVSAGALSAAVGREEAWIAERLRAHLHPEGPHDQALSDGRWVRVSERPTKEGGIVGVRTDITEIKKVEQALRDSEARFRDFAEAASDWYWESDADHHFTFVSRAGVDDVGLRPEDVIGLARYELPGMVVEPGSLARHRADLQAHRAFRDFVYARRLADGRIVHFRVSGKPRFGADGQFLGYRGVGSEITAEVQAEGRRQEAETRLARAIEAIPAAFTLFDADDRLVAVNKVNKAVYETPAVSMVPGAYYPDLASAFAESGRVAGSKADADAWLARRINRRNDPARGFEFQRRDGDWIEINDYLLDDGSLITVGQDITERKRNESLIRQREAELAQLLRRSTLDEMASVMAHELNQPLAAMVNYVGGSLRRIESGTMKPEDISEIMARISEQAQRASDVLRRIGGFVGQANPDRSPVDMADIVSAVADMLHGQLQAAGIRLRIDLAIEAPPVLVDRIEIEQVLLNLARNAMEAMEGVPIGDREIHLHTRVVDDDSLEVSVSDTGPGFAEDSAASIFEPFVTTKENGMGMGLSISRTIVESHGGRIRIDRRGRGGTVRLTLPFDREALENVA